MSARKFRGSDTPTSPTSASQRRGRQFAFRALLVTYIGSGLCFGLITTQILVAKPEDSPENIKEEPHWGALPDVFLCANGFEPEFLYSDARLEADDHQRKIYSIVSDGSQAFSGDIHSAIAADPIGIGGTCVAWKTSAMAPTGQEWNEVRLSTSFLPPTGSPIGRLSLRLVTAASEGGTVFTATSSIDSYKLGGEVGIDNSFTLHKTWTEWEHVTGHERIGMVTANLASKMHVDHPDCPSQSLKATRVHSCEPKLEVADIVVSLYQQHPQVRFCVGKELQILRLGAKVGIVLAVVTFGYLAGLVIFPWLMPRKRSRHTAEAATDTWEVGPDLVE